MIIKTELESASPQLSELASPPGYTPAAAPPAQHPLLSPPSPHSPSSTSPYAPTPSGYYPKTTPPNLNSQWLCFSRLPPEGLDQLEAAHAHFRPMHLVGAGDSLRKGFPLVSPPSRDRPHPFAVHDVNEVDWVNFLTELQESASLSDKDVKKSYLAFMVPEPVTGVLGMYAVRHFMKNKKDSAVLRTIANWNHHFFEPRKLHVLLMKGRARFGDTEGDRSNEGSPTEERLPNSPGERHDLGLVKANDDIYRLFVVPLDHA